jgi:hypothetical protein
VRGEGGCGSAHESPPEFGRAAPRIAGALHNGARLNEIVQAASIDSILAPSHPEAFKILLHDLQQKSAGKTKEFHGTHVTPLLLTHLTAIEIDPTALFFCAKMHNRVSRRWGGGKCEKHAAGREKVPKQKST